MSKTRPPYALEFRRQMVELVRAGRTPEELSREFEPSAQTIRNWATQSEVDEETREGVTSVEREELRRLRREVKQLRLEREILAKAAARPTPAAPERVPRPGRPRRYLREVPVREGAPSHLPDRHDVPRAGGLHQRLLRVA